jgi:hypothetical protein
MTPTELEVVFVPVVFALAEFGHTVEALRADGPLRGAALVTTSAWCIDHLRGRRRLGLDRHRHRQLLHRLHHLSELFLGHRLHEPSLQDSNREGDEADGSATIKGRKYRTLES